MSRKLVYFVATTIDGFIAGLNGAMEMFLPEGEHLADIAATLPETIPGHLREHFGVSAPNRRFDTVLMGRRTYQPALDLGISSPYPHLKQYVWSRSLATQPDPAITVFFGDPIPTVRALKREPGRDIWLCGGGELAAAVFPELDELIVKINPVVIGAGTPLLAGSVDPARFALTHSRQFANGFVMLQFIRQR
jgi:dihydrofolate reductase